jgi:uncharacterized protein (TIGR04255 family)
MSKNVYNYNFLEEIIFELKFPYNLLDEDKVKNFHEKISPDFGYLKVKNKQEINLKINNNKGEFKATNTPTAYLFYDSKILEKSTKYIEIGKGYIILDYKTKKNNYHEFKDLKKYIILICDSLSVYELKKTDYIGLRYINQILCPKGDFFQWEGIIDQKLLNSDIYEKYEKISRFMHNLSFKKDEFNIIFQFGQFNSEYPNPIARKEFVLGYDCNLDEPTYLIDVAELTEKMNNTIYELFEESIGNNLRKTMKK